MTRTRRHHHHWLGGGDLRSRCLRMALVPTVSMGVLGGAVLVVVLAAQPPVMTVTWVLIVVAVAVGWLIVVLAAKAADDTADAAWYLRERISRLSQILADGHQDLHDTIEEVKAGHRVPARPSVAAEPASADPFDQFEAALHNAISGAEQSVGDAAGHLADVDAARRFAAFSTIAWRLQSLLHRQIQLFDLLEGQLEDPEVLSPLYQADHLATRMQRLAESLAVVGGKVTRRQWNQPVSVYEAVRSAISAVEHYQRVSVLPAAWARVAPIAVANLIHLLAELIENATTLSPGEVTVTIELVSSGLMIEIDDRGLGMPATQRQRLNMLLADPSRVDRARLLHDGQFGLYVVAVLAHRHRIQVELRANAAGGTRATIAVPKALLATEQHLYRQAGPSPGDKIGATGRFSAASVQAVPAEGSSSPGRSGEDLSDQPSVAGLHGRGEPQVHMAGRAQPVPGGVPTPSQRGRAPLPQRTPQQNLSAELRDPHRAGAGRQPGHAPGLMGGFRAGWRRGDRFSAGDRLAVDFPVHDDPARELTDVHNERDTP